MPGRTLDEHGSKTLLSRHGLKVPRMVKLDGGLEGIEFPVALKAVSSEIKHKTEAGAVVLDIGSEEELHREAEQMRERLPGVELMAEEMVPAGLEAIVGVVDDPTFGPVIMVGLGGTLAELLADTAFRKLPIDARDAAEMIAELEHHELFGGFRGHPDVTDELVRTLVAVSGVVEAEDIYEMDLNPVVLNENGAVIVDAKISVHVE